MFHCSLFFILVSVITICADWRDPSINIFIKDHTYCDIETKFIQPPSFQCEKNDFQGTTFNETYASFIWNDDKCYGMIEIIKTQARVCANETKVGGWRRFKGFGHRAVYTSSRYGTSQKDKRPLGPKDIYG